MTILSIDLAYKSYADIGAITLEQKENFIECRLHSIPLSGVPSPESLALHLNDFCIQAGIKILLLDGPQGWKAKNNGLDHSRRCERELNTPAKTGEPFSVKPAPYGKFVNFSVDVYDALGQCGWKRFTTDDFSPEKTSRLLIESFPLSAWRALGINPLPAKRKTKSETLIKNLTTLKNLFPLHMSGIPTHDQLQALVAGLVGLAVEQNNQGVCLKAGLPPIIEQGIWREGFILNRASPNKLQEQL